MSQEPQYQLDKKYRLQWEPSQKHYILLFAEGLVQLNDSAADILKLCDGQHSESDIITDMISLYGTHDIAEDVKTFIKEAQNNGWINAE